ncbi:hypothetical protein FACS1894156_8920 [Bacteroidia bacterium]|nr:hypothetical protein FACS1894156_8920 [Bacteroidia bacterium]
MKNFDGKAIYNPSGKAGEYSYWACNFYVGCSNGCKYCYCKKGIFKGTMGGDKPTLKKCFKDENHALEIFEKELKQNLPELQKHGLFFTFSSDPLIDETFRMTIEALDICLEQEVSVKLLTKSVPNIKTLLDELDRNGYYHHTLTKYVAFGFTLTGHDELEPNASTNAERIEEIRKLHDADFKTWASIEPVINFERSLEMILQTRGFCDLYKVGLESGKKYNYLEIRSFMLACYGINGIKSKFYFKDELLKQAVIKREHLPDNCVSRDYNIFNN